MFCSKCGKPNAASATFCDGCGAPLANTTTEFTGGADQSLRTFIGSANQGEYMARFERFENNGKVGPSWHWPAFFVFFYWAIYRKMWLVAILSLVLPWVLLLVLAAGVGMGGSAGASLFSSLFFPLILAWIFVPPIFAHALYYKHAKSKIAKIEANNSDMKTRLAELTRKGGTSNVIAIVAVIVLLIMMIGILAAVSVPAYNDYLNKSKMVQAVNAGEKAGAAVGTYFETNKAIPATLADAGFNGPLPAGLDQIVLNKDNGSLELRVFAGKDQLKTIVLMPAIGAGGKVSWSCSSDNIADKMLPVQCRKDKLAR